MRQQQDAEYIGQEIAGRPARASLNVIAVLDLRCGAAFQSHPKVGVSFWRRGLSCGKPVSDLDPTRSSAVISLWRAWNIISPHAVFCRPQRLARRHCAAGLYAAGA